MGDRLESALRRLGRGAGPFQISEFIRPVSLLLFLGLWGLYAYAFSNPGMRDRFDNLKGTDFVLWYTLGDFGRNGDVADLYRGPAFLEERQFALVPESKGDYYVCLYPPQMTALFAPLAGLPYLPALLIWSAIGVVAYAACVFAVGRTCPGLRPFAGRVALCAAAYPGFFNQICYGQCAIVSLGCVTVAYLALDRGRPVLAGMAIGMLAFKPTLAATAIAIFLLAGEWRLLAGVALGAGLQYGAATLAYGPDVMTAWVRAMVELGEALQPRMPKLYNMHCLRAFWSMLIPAPMIARGLYVASALGVIFLAWRAWRRNTDIGLKFAAVLLATVLASPHLYVYDLLILAPALLVLADRAVRSDPPPVPGLYVALCYAVPLLGPLADMTHVQLSVPAFVIALWLLSRVRATHQVDTVRFTHPTENP
jgi:alpha-1,2-mannosyltransferase